MTTQWASFAQFGEDFGSFRCWKNCVTMDLYRDTSVRASVLEFWSLEKSWHVGLVSCHNWSLCCLPRGLMKPLCHDGTVMWQRWDYYRNFLYKSQMRIQKKSLIFRRIQSIWGDQRPRNTQWISHQLIVGPNLYVLLFLCF